MGRNKSSAPATYAPLSGPLGEELQKHAYERCRHYYLYAFTLSILHGQIQGRAGTQKNAASFVMTRATHQIDSGHRSSNPLHNTWITDPGVVHMPVTAFKRMDAAHFCNLGASPELQRLVAQGGVGLEAKFLEHLEGIMGNTRPMPQQVNIGPDRIVDELHSRKIFQDLTIVQPLISVSRITDYFQQASSAMHIYMQSKLRDKPGLLACASCYQSFYADMANITRLYSWLSRAVEEECSAYDLDVTPYVI